MAVPSDRLSASQGELEPLLALVAEDMAAVNKLILSKTYSGVDLIPELAQHLIDSGGKRLRPMLTLAGARLCGYSGAGHINLAASVEFMHTATLLHDDVVDESDLRRGKPAARLLWGNEASVLVGDFLLGKAFQMMVEVGSLAALKVLSEAAATIAEGEVMQLAATGDLTITEETYNAVIDAKTAALFAAAAEIGPILAARSEAEIVAMRAYGHHLGMAFQLMDDVLDYSGEMARLGKNIGDDFREGKVTLPVLLAYQKGDEEERAFWQRTIGSAQAEADGPANSVDDEANLTHAITLIGRHDTLAATVVKARQHATTAADALAIFPESPARTALTEALAFCVNRRY